MRTSLPALTAESHTWKVLSYGFVLPLGRFDATYGQSPGRTSDPCPTLSPMTDRDPKPDSVLDPMEVVLARRREMLAKLLPMPGQDRRPVRRGDYEQRWRRR